MPATKPLEINGEAPRRSPIGGVLGEDHIGVLLSSVGTRLNRGATAYYRAAWNLSMVEFRLIMVLKDTETLNVGELSEAADQDKAAVSRSLALLEERKLVSIEQTRTRGRAAIARLTAEGRKLSEKLLLVSRERETMLFKYVTPADKQRLKALLHQLTLALDGPDWDY
jgi:DNA-binding MarR family transcriptional regulator